MLCLALWLSASSIFAATAVDTSSISGLENPSASIDQVLVLLKSDEESIILELYTPAYQVQEKQIDGTTYHAISVKGYGETSVVGRPQLPIKGVMLGVSFEAKFEVHVLETDSTIAVERYDVCPVPKMVIREDPYDLGSLRELSGLSSNGIKYMFTKDEEMYSTDAFYPTDLVRVTSVGYLRDQRFAQLQLHPLQYNPVTQQLRFHKRMKVELRFVYDESKATSAVSTGEIGSPFEEVMRNAFINYESVKKWRRKAAAELTASIQGQNSPASQLSYKIAVDQDGIYQLTYNDLLDAGVDVDNVDPRIFKLYNQGSEVAIYVTGEEDGVFNPGDYVLFYGQKMTTKYTNTNTYWLICQGDTGLRMSEKDGTLSGTAFPPAFFRATIHLEQNQYYISNDPHEENADHWYWTYIGAPTISSRTFDVALTNIDTGSYSTTLRSKMQGLSSDPGHYTQIYINDNLIEDAEWSGKVERISTVSFSSSYLEEGTNTIRVERPGTPDLIYDYYYLNWFEIDYRDTYIAGNDSLCFSGDEAGTWEYHVDGFTTDDIEAFDITDPADVSHIINAVVEPSSNYILKFEDTITDRREYLALTTTQRLSPLSIVQDTPSDLYSPGNGADYIVITHADFYDEVLPLINRRAAQGLRTTVVDVQDIYDEFSYGVFDPQAIHDFLAYAYANWQPPAPSYVLLVGDGNYDFKDNLGTGEPNYIPPYLAMVDPSIGETATDNRYACVSGDDVLADMYIGRLPAQSGAEADTMVNKILSYEQTPPDGDWNQKVLFGADNVPDDAGDFVALSNDIVDNYLPGSYMPHEVYINSYCGDPTSPPTLCPTATAAIIGAINEGCLLTNYIGHGHINYWAAEKLLTNNDITSLTNGNKLPIMLPMTCMDGHFHKPQAPCLGESIVRAQGKGAIASWSPTGFGMATGHDFLNEGFFTAVFSDTISEIGPATYLGKLNLYENTTSYRDLMDTYVLFGDPFMKLNLPACNAADFDNNGRITVADIMQVAARWDTEWGDAGFDRKYDLDDDGDIDIVDIMHVAARWDEVC